MDDTIVAISTPPGRGGIGVVRLSGEKAHDIGMKVTQRDRPLTQRVATYANFYSNDNALLDSGLILYFKAPHSFTGEDIIEFQGHGSPFILDRLVSICVEYGARLARPGEFSERAFLNQKIDLTQAEAIADLIHSQSETAARLAVRSLQGDFSQQINTICEKLLTLRLHIEAAIDFSDEAIDFLNIETIQGLLLEIDTELKILREGANQGALLREGGIVVISGPPNAGKSTLLNVLSGYDAAIVHDEAGTTRDILRERVLLDDMPLQLIDTAGLRDSDNLVEQEGIRRAYEVIKQADLVLLMFDITAVNSDFSLEHRIQSLLPPDVPVITIFNKTDKVGIKSSREALQINLSLKEKDGVFLLKSCIKEVLGYQPTEGIFLARRRHIEALNQAQRFLFEGKKHLNEQPAWELLAEDLRQAHDALGEIVGRVTSDDLLGEIFSTFCIGK